MSPSDPSGPAPLDANPLGGGLDGEEVSSAGEVNRRGESLQRLVARLDVRIAKLERFGERCVAIRSALFLGGAVVAGLCFARGASVAGWVSLLVFSLAFSAVWTVHRRSRHALKRHRLWRAIKLGHLARIRLDWSSLPSESVSKTSGDHPFDDDLDITGPRSLHRLLDSGVSEGGARLLRDWLLKVRPEAETIRHRQDLIRELTPLTLFRDKLSLQAELSPGWEGGKLSEKALLDWLAGETPRAPLVRALRVFIVLLAANAGLFLLWLLQGTPPFFLLTTLACAGFLLRSQTPVERLFGDGLLLEKSILGHHRIFRLLESFHARKDCPISRLLGPFQTSGSRPSQRLRRVARSVSAMSVRAYAPAWIALNLLAPWDFFFALRLQREKEELARLLPLWLQVWFECEAANSLANFAWSHPAYARPRLDPATEGLQARRLGHPLIPGSARVCNDFALRGRGKIVLVTGSNMAGKSTFLRTVGLNLCLAQAGGPVCAEDFRWSPLRIHSCIRISDSLSDGFSYFYAEVRRLRRILDEVHSEDTIPALFLIDEIFKGTNNRERLIGSRSYVRALASAGGRGLISTHDLELAALADQIAGLENRHFREEVVAGRMEFDYRLRPGPCPTTNALKIMRMQGLPVDLAES